MSSKTAERQSALVTGAAKRVGREIALGLARRGFDIVLHYNSSENEALQLKEEIEKCGVVCAPLSCNLAGVFDAAAVIAQCETLAPNLRLIVNNASIFEPRNLLETTSEDFERNFGLHVRAPLFLMIEFAKACGEGHVINVVDTMVKKNNTDYLAYLLSKKSLFNLTELAAASLGPRIRVNAIAPGSVFQPVDDNDISYMSMRAEQVPLKMAGSPQYLMSGINYLLDNPFVTGECLFIDGGAHLGY